MTRSYDDLLIELRKARAATRKAIQDQNAIERETYKVPSWSMKFGKLLQQLDQLRSMVEGCHRREQLLNMEIFEALNPEMA